jgi:hypothetical protein
LSRTLLGLLDSAETSEGHQKIIEKLGAWFPHIFVRFLDNSKVALIDVGHLLAGGTSINPL